MDTKQKVGGAAAMVAAATIVVGLGMYATLLSDYTTGDGEPAASVEFIADHYPTMYIWNLIVMVVFGGLLVPVALALYDRLMTGAAAVAQAATAFALIWAGLQTGRLPKMLVYLGFAMSASAFATVVPALELVAIVFGLGLIVWLGWLGLIMYRSPTHSAG